MTRLTKTNKRSVKKSTPVPEVVEAKPEKAEPEVVEPVVVKKKKKSKR